MARVPSSVRTRKRLKEMLAGDTDDVDTSTCVRQAVRLMIEGALEAEVSERLSVQAEWVPASWKIRAYFSAGRVKLSRVYSIT